LIRKQLPALICLLLLTIFAAAVSPLHSQSFDLDRDRQPLASIDGFWRFHPGDNPAWAAPGFDDSRWKLLRSDHSWYVQGYPGMSGYAWCRFTVHLPAASGPTSLLLGPILTGYRVYVDGQPAEVLAHLNRVPHGQITGFATCCAALIEQDGTMTIANAGHLSPCRNGSERTVDGGLPLGLLPDADYTESFFKLNADDHLTFISDGVLEATSSTGELFGFERTQAISMKSAQTIADTAKNFGQEDDITVLTLTLTPEAVLHA
jgi:hypothetical protein